MQLWFVCFLMLFGGAEVLQWLGGLPWVGSIQLSLPLTILGGLGLAIASNSVMLQERQGADPEVSPPPPGLSPPSNLSVPDAIAAPPAPAKAMPKQDTISFEIKKPRRG